MGGEGGQERGLFAQGGGGDFEAVGGREGSGVELGVYAALAAVVW